MKKSQTGSREENKKLHRLSLRRETIKALDDLAFLQFVKGGLGTTSGPSLTLQGTS